MKSPTFLNVKIKILRRKYKTNGNLFYWTWRNTMEYFEIFQGSSDSPLTELGISQAENFQQNLKMLSLQILFISLWENYPNNKNNYGR